MSDNTPTQIEAMESTTDTRNVKVDMVGGAKALPTHSKLAHVLGVFISGAIALAVATVLADGTSVIKLKPTGELPIITDPSLASQGIKYRADELLGPTYGIGLHHDQSGRTWTEIGAGETVKSLVKNLGIPVIAAALPGVIAEDGARHRRRPIPPPPPRSPPIGHPSTSGRHAHTQLRTRPRDGASQDERKAGPNKN